MIRAAHNLLSELQPCWVNARVRLPHSPSGLVLLVHNQHPAREAHICEQIGNCLVDRRLGICTVGLTHANEHVRGRMILDVESLTDRLNGVITFLRHWNETSGLPIALFGEDICAASAIAVAASPPPELRVVGSFCGRPDLATLQLPRVCLPTLLVVPGGDHEILARNEQAFAALNCPSQIAVIGHATRSLGEAGAVGACRYLIRRWCEQHLLTADELASTQP
jgi:putative phosphoribosyl transferase